MVKLYTPGVQCRPHLIAVADGAAFGRRLTSQPMHLKYRL